MYSHVCNEVLLLVSHRLFNHTVCDVHMLADRLYQGKKKGGRKKRRRAHSVIIVCEY